MPPSKDFTDKVYSCLSTAATLWPYRPDYEPTEPEDVRGFQVVTIDKLAKLLAEVAEIKPSGIDLDIFAGHHGDPRNYHAEAISLAESACSTVLETAYGVNRLAGIPGSHLRYPGLTPPGAVVKSWQEAVGEFSGYAEAVVKNWPAVVVALKSLPHVDVTMFWQYLKAERIGAKREQRLAALLAEKASEAESAAQAKRPSIRRGEANLRARDALKGKPPKGKKRWTQRTLAKAIGCSATQAGKLPAFRAYLEENCKTKTAAPKTVSLTNVVLDNKGQDDAELNRLIDQYQANFEPSPLISNARNQRRRPKV
ncbi:MAG: hypothetical protein ABSG53_33200 [Thermoguttaceae bacterium]|jgi:hypothetical protein